VPSNTNPTSDLAVFKTKPVGSDGNFTIGWQQTLQDLIAFKTNSPKAYRLTHTARLALITSNVTLGSTAFETDTNHLFYWNGVAWMQIA
jgi:hypothetical protein